MKISKSFIVTIVVAIFVLSILLILVVIKGIDNTNKDKDKLNKKIEYLEAKVKEKDIHQSKEIAVPSSDSVIVDTLIR